MTVVVVGSAGLYHMETERNWLFIGMLAVLPAAAQLARDADGSLPLANLRFVAVLLLAQTLVQETLLYTLW